jgi:hypothetical protein
MKVDKLHVLLVAVSLLGAGCASQPTQMQKAAAQAAATNAAPNNAQAAAATATKEDAGPFRKVVRDGNTLYCDPSPRTGTRMSKPYCLTEAQYADWKEKNAALKEDMRRGSVGITTDNRDPGPR